MFVHTRIAAVISHSGLTKTAFAERLGISQPHVSMLANGKATPSDRTIADICREFGVSETWLRTGEGEMHVLTDAETELADFCARLLTGVSPPLIRRVSSFLAGCSVEEIDVLTRLSDRWCEEWQKENDTEK